MDCSPEFSMSSGDSGRLNSRTHRAAAGADAESVWNGGAAAGASVRAASENGHAPDTDGVQINKSRVTSVCLPVCVEPRQGRSARRRVCAPGPSPAARASRSVSLARTAGPGPDRLCRVDAERGTQSVGGFARSVRAGVAVTALALLAVTIAGVLAVAFPGTARAQAPSPGVCDRTPQVRDKLVEKSPVSQCSQVTSEHLAGITELELESAGITSLKSGDFAGLTSLMRIDLSQNSLTELPPNIFDGLENLSSLSLVSNYITSFSPDVFKELTELNRLSLQANSISSLDGDIFDTLTRLTELLLDGNRLITLPNGIFDNLTMMIFLNLTGNNVVSLPASIFQNNKALTYIDLRSNNLIVLPNGIFETPDRLDRLCLFGNPGFPIFVPTAFAQDMTVARGAAVTLDASASGGPWGTNVTYAWTQTGGTTVTLTVADTATPSFYGARNERHADLQRRGDRQGRACWVPCPYRYHHGDGDGRTAVQRQLSGRPAAGGA